MFVSQSLAYYMLKVNTCGAGRSVLGGVVPAVVAHGGAGARGGGREAARRHRELGRGRPADVGRGAGRARPARPRGRPRGGHMG